MDVLSAPKRLTEVPTTDRPDPARGTHHLTPPGEARNEPSHLRPMKTPILPVPIIPPALTDAIPLQTRPRRYPSNNPAHLGLPHPAQSSPEMGLRSLTHAHSRSRHSQSTLDPAPIPREGQQLHHCSNHFAPVLSTHPRAHGQGHGNGHPHPPPTSMSACHVPPIGTNSNDTRSTNRYQPSRGAQRDAKWNARNAEREREQMLRDVARVGVIKHGHNHHGRPQSITDRAHPYLMSHDLRPTQRAANQVHHITPTQAEYDPRFALGRRDMLLCKLHVPQAIRSSAYRRTSDGWDPMGKMLAEQHAAVARARRARAEEAARGQAQEDNDKKTRRIQLQVFVHARPTPCGWTGCEAVLNSWALLEKHLYRAHLQSSMARIDNGDERNSTLDTSTCHWKGCARRFESAEAVYRHALVVHMSEFSARCPFNCQFEGLTFASLVNHISRCHPTATPEDFVPGLIHHRPLYLPPQPELPPLPGHITFPLAERLTPLVQPFSGVVGSRTIRAVKRGCIGGKRPRKVDWEDKVGAGAAIWAVVENAKRLSAAGRSDEAERQDRDSVASGATLRDVSKSKIGVDPSIAEHVHEWSDSDTVGASDDGRSSLKGVEEAPKPVPRRVTGQSTLSVDIPSAAVRLLDVERSAKAARDEATQALALDPGICQSDSYGTSSTSGSPTSRGASEPGLPLSTDIDVAGQDVAMSDRSDGLESEGDDSSIKSARSPESNCNTKVKLQIAAPRAELHGAEAIEANRSIKWSERLRKKPTDM